MAIVAKKVCKTFGEPPTEVLTDINVQIGDGEFVALTGKSGSGKSTLLYLLSTLDKATSGTIEISGREIQSMNSEEIHHFRNEEMGFVFQFHYLISELTALENVLLPSRKIKQLDQHLEYAKELLEKFELGNKLHRLPRQLSGGEQQRVAIARALVMKPKYLFADEPTGSLDSINSDKVMNILNEVNQSGTAVILVTHDPDFAKQAQRKIQLADGKVVI